MLFEEANRAAYAQVLNAQCERAGHGVFGAFLKVLLLLYLGHLVKPVDAVAQWIISPSVSSS
jgi:hypothetical protein